MFDAEIAATLLNRWEHEQPAVHGYSPLELLREGKLPFSRQIGKIWPVPNPSENESDIESLTFSDGSRVLRFWREEPRSGWTRWAPIAPTDALYPTDCCTT